MNFFISRYRELGHAIEPEGIRLRPAIRVNTLKISEDALVKRLSKKVKLAKIPFADSGYWVESDFALSSTPEYLHGYYYIQEAASQLPVKALAPEEGELVLDMCAAPGSKTTQLAQVMRDRGRIVALESNSSRLPALKNNLERCGVKSCIVCQKDASHSEDLGIVFDKVLLDAPCSGNFVADPGWFEKRSIEGVKIMAKTQRALLRSAVQVAKPVGTIVYSTCSLEPEEDEDVIEWALDNLPVKLVDSGIDVGEPGLTSKTRLCRRLWPENTGTQGFFMAKLCKR
jgi:NOL1/NOP2/sun family putative RNA methylase